MNTKLYCEQRGKEIADRLIERVGGDWKVNVWENMGWHFNVQCGTLSISECVNGYKNKNNKFYYYIMVSKDEDNIDTGHSPIQNLIKNSCKTPEQAVKNAIDAMDEYTFEVMKLYYSNKRKFNVLYPDIKMADMQMKVAINLIPAIEIKLNEILNNVNKQINNKK